MRAQWPPSMPWSTRNKAGTAAGLATMLFAMSVIWGVSATTAKADTGIPIQWDGPTINLSWDGGSYTTASGSIVSDVVAVPGDWAERTAIVRNAGPSPACVTVQIFNVMATNSPDTVNSDLEALIHLFWNINGNRGDMTWRQAHEAADPNGVAYTVSFHLSQGEKFPLTAGYYFPASATAGKNAGAPSSILRFDVRILMQGDDHVKIPTGGAVESPTGIHLAVLMVTAGVALPIAARVCNWKYFQRRKVKQL